MDKQQIIDILKEHRLVSIGLWERRIETATGTASCFCPVAALAHHLDPWDEMEKWYFNDRYDGPEMPSEAPHPNHDDERAYEEFMNYKDIPESFTRWFDHFYGKRFNAEMIHLTDEDIEEIATAMQMSYETLNGQVDEDMANELHRKDEDDA